MRRSFVFGSIAVAACAIAWPPTAVQGQAGKKEVFVSADKATFTEVIPGASRATAWGDPDKGPHGALTKFTPGFDAGTHTHTSDLRIVVIRGAYPYETDAGQTRVGPGSYLFVPGGIKHWSGGDPKEGALFYQEGLGKFDLNPVK